MKYSILLVGKNGIIKDDFFTYLWKEFECLTASGRYEDIKNHLKYFTPAAMVYCLREEDKSSMQQVLAAKDIMQQDGIPLVIIGSHEDCNDFLQYAPSFADLVLEKPITSERIAVQLTDFLCKYQSVRERMLAEEKERREKEAEQRAAQEAERAREQQKDEPEGEQTRKHVLVIDDEPLMLKMIKEHLHDKYDVATAISGKIAMKFLASKTTDLILLDYEMPEENGPEVLEQLHQNEATKDIPVVFLTGIIEREKILKALQLKPQSYLVKPIDHDKLLETIRQLIG